MLEGVDADAAQTLAASWRKVDEIPFDFERRRMSVVVAQQADVHQLICKGALAEILSVCSPRCALTARSSRWMRPCCGVLNV